ncbi:hypothetical protein ACTNDN_23200 [Niallia sp. HCP3S3_B10]|uniref:hypothetical protein n=1 Tax=Niallia sp. HCP3S3_B10 TaxID=3438944 RepID=UPI003F8A9D62
MKKTTILRKKTIIPFSHGKYKIKEITYYLQDNEYGLRVEVTKFSLTGTVEVRLVYGGGAIIEKIYITKIIVHPTKQQLEKIIKEFCVNSRQYKKLSFNNQ